MASMADGNTSGSPEPIRRRVAAKILGPAPASPRRSRFDRLASPHADSSLPEAMAGVALSVVLLLVMLWACLHWENPALRVLAILGSLLGVFIVVRAGIVVNRKYVDC